MSSEMKPRIPTEVIEAEENMRLRMQYGVINVIYPVHNVIVSEVYTEPILPKDFKNKINFTDEEIERSKD